MSLQLPRELHPTLRTQALHLDWWWMKRWEHLLELLSWLEEIITLFRVLGQTWTQTLVCLLNAVWREMKSFSLR